jgi:large subunit ribosomal protein L6
MPIAVPQGVDVQIANNQITVKGANGTLARPDELAGRGPQGRLHAVVSLPANDGMEANAMSGTMRALVNNMVNGVTKGFEKKLNLVGVGFRAQAQGRRS